MTSVTINWKAVIDRPIAQTMSAIPVVTAAGACISTDGRGGNRYIYVLLSATSFWRYDVQTDGWQQLPSPTDPIVFGVSCAMCFDPSRGTAGYVWLFGAKATSTWAYFQYYDIAANTWTSRAIPAGLAAAWGTSAALCHTCSTYNGAGNDDYIYLIGNGATTLYRYSIVGNAWSALPTAITAAPGAGCDILWAYGYNTDLLYIIRGATTATIYTYTIGVPAMATITYNPATETFGAGTGSVYDGGNRIYIQNTGTQRVFMLNLATPYTMTPGPVYPYIGTGIQGNKLAIVKSTEDTPASFLYFAQNTGQYLWRYLVTW